ncbi:MAG TPA: symmetrical bis(5'-nucleosyl)-tetraphosphatase [Patescibacteria group bacterium]|nr:symmetrical bis(5'-nucleosyl)-tetraphosphatase [Patescibacteria group bacterium]
MATYAIGDVQGCYDALARLLEHVKFDSARDRLWFCGDLVNRGGHSLEVLRLVRGLDAQSTVVLGNHDLSLLAVSERKEADQRRANVDLARVLMAADREDLLAWLRHRPLMHIDRELGFAMVHAGLAPRWTLNIAKARAAEVERKLQGSDYRKLLKQMFGDRPALWSKNLKGLDRLRAIINVMTRMRFCDVRGQMNFEAKGAPGTQSPGLYPWFEVPGHAPRDLPIVCGHWSTLGLFQGLGIHAIDTGAVWGGKLTALELGPEPRLHAVQCEARLAPRGRFAD